MSTTWINGRRFTTLSARLTSTWCWLRGGAALPVFIGILACMSWAPLAGQNPRANVPPAQSPQPAIFMTSSQARLERVFELTNEFGDREVVELTLGAPGPITVEATWRGTADGLAIILNGPGQVGFFARQDGASPLSLTFDVTPALLARGDQWTVSIVNFSRRGRAVGRVRVVYPPSRPAITALPLDVQRLREMVVTAKPAAPAQPERSILSDGQVQIRYPDGRVVIYAAQCGSTTIFPDGTHSTALCNQVQAGSLPALPSDPALRSFLEVHRDHLLEYITQLVDHRQPEVDLYLTYEADNARGLFEQIRMRVRLIDNLLR